MKQKAIQLFSDEYLEECKKMSPTQIAEFLENFRLAQSQYSSKSKLISLKIPEDLLENFKEKARRNGEKYQTKIKDLMREWLINN